MLKPDQNVTAEQMQTTLRVVRSLGEGGQGVVYLVEGPSEQYALKWYHPSQATDAQRLAIWDLVIQHRPPGGRAGKRFIWPLDLVTAEDEPGFGYLMKLIDTDRFVDLTKVMSGRVPAPGLDKLCEICYQLAHSFRALHLAGYCYRDISRNNVLFDANTGDVLICDNDNIGINRASTCQIWGTLEYMAPELVRGEETHPSTQTDLHSLAVLLFYLWMWHHPFHGEMEYRIRCWDLQAKKLIYGERPVFIWDPHNTENRLPADPDYRTAEKRWQTMCPTSLRDLFTKAFTEGVKDPGRRVTEGEWQRLFQQLKDSVLPCPSCRASNLWDPHSAAQKCWHCERSLPGPPRLEFNYIGKLKHYVVLTKGARLLHRHVDPHADEDRADQVLGEVVPHPSDPKLWGLRNLSKTPWVATAANQQVAEVPPNKAVPAVAGLRLTIGGVTAELVT